MLEAVHAVGELGPGREDDDLRLDVPLPHPPQDVDPVEVREAEVQHHHVGVGGSIAAAPVTTCSVS